MKDNFTSIQGSLIIDQLKCLLFCFPVKGSISTDGGVANPRCGGNHAVTQGEGKYFYCRPYLYGRYVTIRSLRSNDLLTLCEVEVYSARRGTTCLISCLII